MMIIRFVKFFVRLEFSGEKLSYVKMFWWRIFLPNEVLYGDELSDEECSDEELSCEELSGNRDANSSAPNLKSLGL
jgi:hypothetical protein